MTIKSHYYADKILAEHPSLLYVMGNDFVASNSVPLVQFSSSYSSTTGKILNQYNSYDYFGYVTSSNSAITVAPIVYGSERSVSFSGSSSSINIPALGFLNSIGKYQTYTLEFWTKIDKPYTGRRKIVGPATTIDDGNGLYVNQTSFILNIGSQSGTAYIKDFNRPFLIQIVYSESKVLLIVNGELLITLSLTTSDLNSLPALSQMITRTDYICFGPGTYDCIALFPYQVEVDQAKLRFAYGQSAPFQEDIVSLFNGQSVVIDYSKGGYPNNYNFPLSSGWKQSINNNLNVTQDTISNYQYSLPTFNSSSKTISDLAATGVFNLKQTTPTDWSAVVSNFQLDSLNVMNQDTKGFYMHGYFTTLPSSEQIVFKLLNPKTGNTFSISVNGSTIYYKIKYDTGTEYTIPTANLPTLTNLQLNAGKYNFIIGIDIESFTAYGINNFIDSNGHNYGKDIKNFFTNPADIIMFIAGQEDLTVDKTLSATITSVKFLNSLDLLAKQSIVYSGIFYYPSAIDSSPSGTEATQNLLTAGYDLRLYTDLVNYTSNKYYFTVATSASWKHDVPLTYFATNTTDATTGIVSYTFDFIQFNFDYESPILTYIANSKTYLDTVNSPYYVRSYITFEPLNSSYQADSVFTKSLPKSDRVVLPDSYWATQKYEITDNFIIYPPSGIDLTQYTMVIHLDFDIPDSVNNVVTIQKMQLSAQAYNANVENPVGTKFGTGIVPYTYTLSGSTKVYDYKAYNPYIINKKQNPHLYMARDSGIRIVGSSNNSGSVYRGIKIPINKELNANYNISIMQLSMFYDAPYDTSSSPYYAKFPNASEQIFEIQTQNRNIKFYLTRTGNGDTATLSAVSGGLTDQNILYYINGVLTTSPTIYTNKWTTVGISFTDPLLFNSYAGEFDLVGGISIDNLSYYQLTPEQISQILLLNQSATQTWQQTATYTWNTLLDFSWNYWLTFGSIVAQAIPANDMYSMFVATNKLISNSDIYNNLAVHDSDHIYYSGVVSSTNTYTPV